MSGIRDPNTTLQQLYAAFDDLISGKLQSYTLGDRTITLFNLDELRKVIAIYEAAVMEAGGPVRADLRQFNPPVDNMLY